MKLTQLFNEARQCRAEQGATTADTLKHMKQKGFTLIELMVVLLIIGVIAALSYPALMGSTDTSRAATLYDASDKMASNWQLINQSCGTTKDVASSTVMTTPSAGAALDVLFRGTGVATAMTACYSNSGVRPMSELAKGTGGSYTVQDYAVAATGGGSIAAPMQITFTGVPTSIALVLYQKYSSASGAAAATALPATADTTDPVVRFTAPSGGTTNLTIVRTI